MLGVEKRPRERRGEGQPALGGDRFDTSQFGGEHVTGGLFVNGNVVSGRKVGCIGCLGQLGLARVGDGRKQGVEAAVELGVLTGYDGIHRCADHHDRVHHHRRSLRQRSAAFLALQQRCSAFPFDVDPGTNQQVVKAPGVHGETVRVQKVGPFRDAQDTTPLGRQRIDRSLNGRPVIRHSIALGTKGGDIDHRGGL